MELNSMEYTSINAFFHNKFEQLFPSEYQYLF